jgi:NADPH:quinone reductase-like Zn-dependent oxidoreductase
LSLSPLSLADFKIARGDLKLILTSKLPLKLGYDVSGVVEAVGAEVKGFKVGDEVFSRVSANHMGSIAEFVLSSEDVTVAKPKNLTHAQASCLPLAGMTALQSLRTSGIEKKAAPRTVFIPAALGGVGSLAIQLARHHFRIEHILTAVSTAKVEPTKQLLGPLECDAKCNS